MALRQLDSNVTLRKRNRNPYGKYLGKQDEKKEEEDTNDTELDEIERLFKNDVKPVGRKNRRLDMDEDEDEFVPDSSPSLSSPPSIGRAQVRIKLQIPDSQSESDSEKENAPVKRPIEKLDDKEMMVKPKRVKQPDETETNETVISSNRNAKGSSIVIAKINKNRLGVKEPFGSSSTPINEATKVVSVFDTTEKDTTQTEENNSDLFGSPIRQSDSRRLSARSNVSKKNYFELDESDQEKLDAKKIVDVKNLKLFEDEQNVSDDDYKPAVLKTTKKEPAKKATQTSKPKKQSSRKATSKTTTKKTKSSKYDDVLVDKELEELAKEYESIKNYKLIVEHVAHD